MIINDLAPFNQWCQSRGITSPLILETDSSQGSRSMCLPPDREDLFRNPTSDSDSSKINVVTVPLDSCIVGQDLPTLVEKLKYEKSLGEQSEFAPWIDLFPTLDDFQTMPRFWDQERIDFVSQYDSGQLKARVDIDKTRIDQQLGNNDDDNNDDNIGLSSWALACIDSRSNFLPDETYSITPLLDMFNHDPRCTTTARIDGDSRLILEVDSDSVLYGLSSTSEEEEEDNNNNKQDDSDWKDKLFGLFQGSGGNKRSGGSGRGSSSSNTYKAGRQVFVSYGQFDNVETLCNYGFISKTNTCNLEQFKVRSIGMLGTQSGSGGIGGGGGGPAILVVDSDGGVDNLFNTMSLDALRLSLATQPDELKDYKGSGIISDRNEIEMYALIVGELDEAIYETKQGLVAAKARKDDLVVSYLEGRRRTLQQGLDKLKTKYPDLF
jgi:hypothetical protein